MGAELAHLCCDAPWLTLQYVLSRQSNMLRCAVSQVYGKTCPTPIYGRADSKRPQALKNRVSAREAEWPPHCGRVACAKRSGRRTAVGLRARSGVEVGTADRRPGIRKDLPDSNLWSGR